MRICLVTSAYHPALGGVESHVRALAEGLVAAGDEVTVLTHHLDPGSPAEERLAGVRVVRVPLLVSAADYRWTPALGGYLRAHRAAFDVVHAHSYHTLVGWEVIRARATPMVFTPHYHGTGHSVLRAALHRPYRPLGRRLLGRARQIVCVSAAEAELVTRDFPETAQRIVVIPNGTDPVRPTPSALRSTPVTPRDVLAVGRLVPYKGLSVLIRAMAALPDSSRLVVVGDGPDRDRLVEEARAAGVGDRVDLLGRIPADDLAAALATAGVVASLSEHEAFGLTVADGLAAGAPVVASDIPAHREVLRLAGVSPDHPAGRLVPRENLAAVAEALVGAIAHGRPGPGRGLPTWADVVAQTRAVYARTAAGAERGAGVPA